MLRGEHTLIFRPKQHRKSSKIPEATFVRLFLSWRHSRCNRTLYHPLTHRTLPIPSQARSFWSINHCQTRLGDLLSKGRCSHRFWANACSGDGDSYEILWASKSLHPSDCNSEGWFRHVAQLCTEFGQRRLPKLSSAKSTNHWKRRSCTGLHFMCVPNFRPKHSTNLYFCRRFECALEAKKYTISKLGSSKSWAFIK